MFGVRDIGAGAGLLLKQTDERTDGITTTAYALRQRKHWGRNVLEYFQRIV